jgi:hypothetical protein
MARTPTWTMLGTCLPLLLRFLILLLLLTMGSCLELVPVPQSLASWILALLLLLLRLLCLGLMLVSSLVVIRTFSSVLSSDNFTRTSCTLFSRLWYQSRKCLLVSLLALHLLGETLRSCPSFSRVYVLIFLVRVLDPGSRDLWGKLFPDYSLSTSLDKLSIQHYLLVTLVWLPWDSFLLWVFILAMLELLIWVPWGSSSRSSPQTTAYSGRRRGKVLRWSLRDRLAADGEKHLIACVSDYGWKLISSMEGLDGKVGHISMT